ncbi:MAG: serine hydrolase [Bacteroidota bacterium]
MNYSFYASRALFLIASFFLGELHANNGTISYAYPVEGIEVDADLSDWPSDIPYQKMETFLFGTAPSGADDLEVACRIGYDLKTQMLYVAVETTDDAVLGDKTDKAEWNTHDIHNFYIDPTHSFTSGSISHLVSADYRRIAENRPEESWDPQVRNASWDKLKVEIRQMGNKTIYEWSYYLGEYMLPGRSIGFDYEVIDKDPEESGFPSVWALGPGAGKAFNTSGMSDLILLEKQADIGTLAGKLVWEKESGLKFPERLIIHAVDNPRLWVMAKVGEEGSYTVQLPQGSYKLSLPYAVRFDDRHEKLAVLDMDYRLNLKVEAGTVSTAEDFIIKNVSTPDIIPDQGILSSFEAAKEKKVDEFMRIMMNYYDVPGASLALVNEGKVVYHQTYGYKNFHTQEKVDGQTLFEAASVSKPVFAFAVNRLVERGEFDLDKPLHEYLEFEAIASDKRYKLMTGRHVLTHTSGLPNWGQELKETPGTKYGYSGEGFEYLKRAVAHHTQRDIEQLVEEEVLSPLGISHTYFSKNDELLKVMAHGHFDLQPTIFDIPTEAGMAHSMHTEAKTFANFMIAILERKGLKAATYEEMLRPQTQTPSNTYYDKLGWDEKFGLGIISAQTPFGKMYGHGGNNGDFRCQFEVFDEGKMGYALFTNGSNGIWLTQALREFLITGKVGME